MYLKSLSIHHLKLVHHMELDFTVDGDRPRPWTIIIGRNGTCKTALLQAIALTAAGGRLVNTIGDRVAPFLRDRRGDDAMEVRAVYSLPSQAIDARLFDGLPGGILPEAPKLLCRLTSMVGERSLVGWSHFPWWDGRKEPLDEARSRELPHWFVAGYGVGRLLPEPQRLPTLERPSIDRMRTLFDQGTSLTAINFVDHFSGEREKSKLYTRMLKKALMGVSDLLPSIKGIEIRGRGGVRQAGDLLDRNRFTQRVGQVDLKVSANALSHGYQSTIAWIADLVGHMVLDNQEAVEPTEMTGLVLIDELDLYLHPSWQVVLVRALTKTFPKIQFIATTHSPLVLAGLRPGRDQIIQLDLAPESGDVVRVADAGDPCLMTVGEIVQAYFGVESLHPDETGQNYSAYHLIASNPYRSDREDAELPRLKRRLMFEGINVDYPPVERIRR